MAPTANRTRSVIAATPADSRARIPGNPFHCTPEDAAEILGSSRERGREHLASRNDDEIRGKSAAVRIGLAEHLSNQTFSSVSLDRAAELSRRDQAQAQPAISA